MDSYVTGPSRISSQKITKIKAHRIKQRDIIARLRASWPGRLYRSRLKRYSAVRRIVRLIYRFIPRNRFYLYFSQLMVILSDERVKRWRRLTRLSEYVKKSGIETHRLADAAVVETPEPRVFPASCEGYLVSPHDRYEFPEIFVATMRNVMVYGGTNLILAEDEVVCHDLYDFRRDYTGEELYGRNLIDPKHERIRWFLHDEAPEPIPVAATFVDACAPNYAHWMTEVLPRVVLFCAENRFKNVPIVVNDSLHANIMESLLLVAGPNREIITLPIGRALAVDELYVTSSAGYVPFERRANRLSGHSHGVFSPRAFETLRDRLSAAVRNGDGEAWPEKIFLHRSSRVRKVANRTELEKLLVARGYVIIQPEKLTFSQQFELFSNARTIVGSSGAAFANIVFAPRNVRIVIIASKHPDKSFWYWQNMAAASGKYVQYFFGETPGKRARSVHDDFSISLDEFSKTLEE